MSIPNQDILTSMLLDFQTRVKPAASLILPYAKNTLYILITIDLALVYIISLIKEEDTGYKTLLISLMKYGTFIFLVMSYSTIVNQIIKTFQMIGLKAAGDTLNVSDFTNPSKISELGIDLTKNLWSNAGSHEGWIMNPVSAVMLTISGLAIIIAFYIIALQVFIITLEFAIIAALGLILIPFGVFTHTEFIFGKIKEAIINFGIKYMVLAFVVSITISMVQGWTNLDAAVTWQQAMYMAFGAMALAYLCYHAPTVASGMSSGGGGSLAGPAMAGAIAGSAMQTKGVAGGTHNGIRGTKDPKTGQRYGGLLGINGTRDGILGVKDPTTGTRKGGLTGEGSLARRMAAATTAAAVRGLSGVAADTPNPTVQNFSQQASSMVNDTGAQDISAQAPRNAQAPPNAQAAHHAANTQTSSPVDPSDATKAVGPSATQATTPRPSPTTATNDASTIDRDANKKIIDDTIRNSTKSQTQGIHDLGNYK